MNDRKLDVFYLLDLDRTLFDTVAASDLMRQAVAEYDPDVAAELSRRIEDYSRLGESFSMYDFILEKVGDAEMHRVVEAYRRRVAASDTLNPGAEALIEFVRQHPRVGGGILTFGSPEGQALKIEANPGLQGMPYFVTSETFKGQLIKSWRVGPSQYRLPEEYGGVEASSIVLVDDKPFSFQGLPADSRGYWVPSIYNAGEEGLPANAVRVPSLADVLLAERRLIDKA